MEFDDLLNKNNEKPNLLYGKPIPQDWKDWYKEVYDHFHGDIPRCPFTVIMNRELGLDYETDV